LRLSIILGRFFYAYVIGPIACFLPSLIFALGLPVAFALSLFLSFIPLAAFQGMMPLPPLTSRRSYMEAFIDGVCGILGLFSRPRRGNLVAIWGIEVEWERLVKSDAGPAGFYDPYLVKYTEERG